MESGCRFELKSGFFHLDILTLNWFEKSANAS
jgi:hypothetical protein